MSDISVVIAGAAGQGVDSAATILGKTLLRHGFHIYTTRDYQSRVRGGHNYMRIRFCDRPLTAAVKRASYLLALNEESLHIHLPNLTEDGLALCMEADKGDVNDPRLRPLSLDIGPETAKGPKFVGVKLLAMLFRLLGYGANTLKEAVNIQFGKRLKPPILQANLDAVDAVSASVDDKDVHPIPFKPSNLKDHLLLSGNDAIALGLIAGGLGFYAGYPMTPSTSILNALATHGPKVGIVVEQMEDEISALNAAVGASYAGARAATGSSGAGMCLMSEAMGLAGITETPVVIIDAQRAGPSTGMATRTEQSDLLFLVNASHGEFPRAVICPATHEDGFYMAAQALNIADQWQVPVFFMSDMAFADAERNVPEFDLSKVYIDRGAIAEEPDQVKVLNRYEITDSGISPRAFPVQSKWLVAQDSHEHDPLGHLTDDIDNRMEQVNKRMRKLDGLASQFPGPEIIGDPDGDLFICWGSTTGPCLEAAAIMREQGHKIAVGIFRYLFPMNKEKVSDALSKFQRIYSVEGNNTGQLGKLVQMETCVKTDGHLGKYDGRPFTVRDILVRMEQVLGGDK